MDRYYASCVALHNLIQYWSCHIRQLITARSALDKLYAAFKDRHVRLVRDNMLAYQEQHACLSSSFNWESVWLIDIYNTCD